MELSTGSGDDGTTELLFGGRVAKDSVRPEACGAVDEAQAAIGTARALCAEVDSDLGGLLLGLQQDLHVVMADLGVDYPHRGRLMEGKTLVGPEMLHRISTETDRYLAEIEGRRAFVVPGSDPVSAALHVARTVVRRAERRAVPLASDDSCAVAYLNRLSKLLWALAVRAEPETVYAVDR